MTCLGYISNFFWGLLSGGIIFFASIYFACKVVRLWQDYLIKKE